MNAAPRAVGVADPVGVELDEGEGLGDGPDGDDDGEGDGVCEGPED